MNLTHYADRAAWLEARRSGLGGSDVPVILGFARYGKTPLSVWTSKVLPPEEETESYTLKRGTFMEGFIAARLREEAGLPSIQRFENPTIVRSKEDPCLLYSPDGFVVDDRGDVLALCEFKSRLRDAREWEEGVPPDVVAQAQHGMDVCDLGACFIACDTGNELRWKRIERDPKWATEVRPRLIAWWHEYVVPQVPPPPEAEDAAVLGRLYPQHEAGLTKAMPGEFVAVREEIEALEATRDAAEARIQELKNRVRAEMGTAEIGVLPTGAGWRWKTQHKKEHVVKASTSRPLTAFKAKER